jgi:gamma-glutamyl phosphate reductase
VAVLICCRDEISDLLKLDDVIDLVIPRGGNALVSHIQVGVILKGLKLFVTTPQLDLQLLL